MVVVLVNQMLVRLLDSHGLLDTIAAPGSFRPPWTARHRALWDGAGEPASRYWIGRGERYLDFDWPSLDATYSDFEQTGNRTRFEALYHKRRQVTTTFVFAEAFENRGRFVPALLDAINRLCDEPTWVLPAHNQHPIDLFSAETGNLLAWAHYLLRDTPGFRDSAAIARMEGAVQERVIDPYVSRDDCWWMALNGEDPGNWTTWCTSNCLGTTLLLETDAGRRRHAIEKACRSLDRFVDAYKADGGCDEGPMYWNFAAGCLFDSLEMLDEASGGAFDVFHEIAIRQIGAYIAKVHVHDLSFVNFADSPPRIPVDAALLYRFGLRAGDERMQALGAHAFRLLNRFDPEDTLRLKIYRALATLPHVHALRSFPGPLPASRDDYLPHLQVAVARGSDRGGHGLTLAAKGGHNDEQHNHNDVGNVVVYLDGHPVLIDIGMKQYNKDTFSDRRYENWAVQSAFHNVPIVNGCQQEAGRSFAARGAVFASADTSSAFALDISAAYPPAARLVAWQRTSTLDRGTETIAIRDTFEFAGGGNGYEQRFITACHPHLTDDGVVLPVSDTLSVIVRTDPSPSRTTLHAIPVKDGQLRHAWGQTLYQIRFHFDSVASRGRCEIVLSSRRDVLSAPPPSTRTAVPIETIDLP